MKAELSEIDQILHFARQSKMDALRSELEKLVKKSASKNPRQADEASVALFEIKELFRKASNNAPLP